MELTCVPNQYDGCLYISYNFVKLKLNKVNIMLSDEKTLVAKYNILITKLVSIYLTNNQLPSLFNLDYRSEKDYMCYFFPIFMKVEILKLIRGCNIKVEYPLLLLPNLNLKANKFVTDINFLDLIKIIHVKNKESFNRLLELLRLNNTIEIVNESTKFTYESNKIYLYELNNANHFYDNIIKISKKILFFSIITHIDKIDENCFGFKIFPII